MTTTMTKTAANNIITVVSLLVLVAASSPLSAAAGFAFVPTTTTAIAARRPFSATSKLLYVSTSENNSPSQPSSLMDENKTGDGSKESAEAIIEKDFETPPDAVIQIQPPAMKRLRELRDKQSEKDVMVLRMGVRNGGCSGLSYIMDFSSEADIQDDDVVDEYPSERLKCVVDAKSMLYLYGLELDYSDELIGGGFKFFNPNAEESCGCGSSFGV